MKNIYTQKDIKDYIQPYIDRNNQDGFPQLNNVEVCAKISNNPQLTELFKKIQGNDTPKEVVKEFITQWFKVCRQVREWHLGINKKVSN